MWHLCHFVSTLILMKANRLQPFSLAVWIWSSIFCHACQDERMKPAAQRQQTLESMQSGSSPRFSGSNGFRTKLLPQVTVSYFSSCGAGEDHCDCYSRTFGTKTFLTDLISRTRIAVIPNFLNVIMIFTVVWQTADFTTTCEIASFNYMLKPIETMPHTMKWLSTEY